MPTFIYRNSKSNQETSMKHSLKTALPYALAAGSLAIALGGCATDRYHDRAADRASDRTSSRAADRTVDRTVERTTTTYTETGNVPYNAPVAVDPFSPGYPAFPAMANESAGIVGHSFYCLQHYNQPGCQTFDRAAAGSDRRIWPQRDRRSDAGDSIRSSEATVPGRY
jgi:hypothetical protein